MQPLEHWTSPLEAHKQSGLPLDEPLEEPPLLLLDELTPDEPLDELLETGQIAGAQPELLISEQHWIGSDGIHSIINGLS